MAKLEDLKVGAWVAGVLPDALVNASDTKWHGGSVVELTYKDASSGLGNGLLYLRRALVLVGIAAVGRPCSFGRGGNPFRLVAEAHGRPKSPRGSRTQGILPP